MPSPNWKPRVTISPSEWRWFGARIALLFVAAAPLYLVCRNFFDFLNTSWLATKIGAENTHLFGWVVIALIVGIIGQLVAFGLIGFLMGYLTPGPLHTYWGLPLTDPRSETIMRNWRIGSILVFGLFGLLIVGRLLIVHAGWAIAAGLAHGAGWGHRHALEHRRTRNVIVWLTLIVGTLIALLYFADSAIGARELAWVFAEVIVLGLIVMVVVVARGGKGAFRILAVLVGVAAIVAVVTGNLESLATLSQNLIVPVILLAIVYAGMKHTGRKE
jgi:hypothetical protein